jgi:hypothetical protein
MVTNTRYGKKLKLPSTVQLKHQLLLRWLADQQEKEAAELNEPKVDADGKARGAQFQS